MPESSLIPESPIDHCVSAYRHYFEARAAYVDAWMTWRNIGDGCMSPAEEVFVLEAYMSGALEAARSE